MHLSARSHLHPRWVANSDSAPAIVARTSFLSSSDDPFEFSHGLSGVDQTGNYLWVNVTLAFFLVLCAGTFILRWTKSVNAHVRQMSAMTNPGRQAFWAENQTAWWPWLKKHLLYSPLGKTRHNRDIQLTANVTFGTIPSRFHTLLLVVYVLSNFAYCLALPWGNPNGASIAAALRGRSGTLAALNLIPTVLFALRNNPLIPILKVSYDTFNLFHRWAARIVIVESVIHTVAWAVNTCDAEHNCDAVGKFLRESTSYRFGMIGTSLFVFIFLQSLSPVRHAFYETFLNFHRLAVMFAIIGVYVHLDTAHLPQVPWIKIVIALWILEWVFRIARIVYFNVSLRTGVTKIKVEALNEEACRITFELRRPWHPRPGCHVHVWMPRYTFPNWHSHPFSVAAYDTTTTSSKRRDSLASEKLPTTEKALDALSLRPTTTRLSLVVRARAGFTRTLYDAACARPDRTLTTWGAVEGPYGGHDSLASYGTVVLFAGGVGITHQVMYVRDLVAGYRAGTVAARRVLLVWSVPNTQCLEWVKPWMDQILQMPGRKDVLRIKLFITKPRSYNEVRSASETVTMYPGRCNPQTILDQEIAAREGAVVVTACGPGPFTDGVRVAVKRRVDAGCVDFIEEAFTY